jgi:Na+/H+-dicarboxylate symporter
MRWAATFSGDVVPSVPVMVLTTVGVPSSGIALIMGIGRILEISRTSITSAATPVVAVTDEGARRCDSELRARR